MYFLIYSSRNKIKPCYQTGQEENDFKFALSSLYYHELVLITTMLKVKKKPLINPIIMIVKVIVDLTIR